MLQDSEFVTLSQLYVDLNFVLQRKKLNMNGARIKALERDYCKTQFKNEYWFQNGNFLNFIHDHTF